MQEAVSGQEQTQNILEVAPGVMRSPPRSRTVPEGHGKVKEALKVSAIRSDGLTWLKSTGLHM